MDKTKMITVALAAALSLAVPFDSGIVKMDLARPAFAGSKITAGQNIAQRSLPLLITVRSYSDWEGPHEMLRAHWTDIHFYGKAREADRNIAKALAEYSRKERDASEKSRKELFADAKEEWRDHIKNSGSFSPYYGPFWFTGDILVRRADGKAVSFLEDNGEYEGGFHGISCLTGKNFDARTGKKLQLSDVFANRFAMAEALKKKLKADYPDASFMENGGAGLDDIIAQRLKEDSLAWTMEPEGVTFWFNPYLLGGTYAEETFVSTFFFDETPGLFKTDANTGLPAWQSPTGYCMDLRSYTGLRLPGNSGNDKLRVAHENNRIRIEYGGQEYSNDLTAVSIRPTFVSCPDGRRYLYVDYEHPASQFSAANYRLYVYDLNGKTPGLIGDFPMTRLASSLKDTTKRSWYVMSDPGDFYTTATADSNIAPGKRLRCRVGKDGRPEVYDVEGAKG